VNADHDVVDAQPQVAKDFYPFEGVDLAVDIVRPDPHLLQVIREVFGHAFRQRGDECPLTTLDASVDLTDEVVDLALRLPDGDLRIEEASRANDLLDDARGMLVFVWAGRRRDEDRLVDHADELGEGEGAI